MKLVLLDKEKIGTLNLLLIVFTFFVAFIFPVATFVWAYAILGPLHYLTQLNWLYQTPVFTRNKHLTVALITLSVLATILFVLQFYDVIGLDWIEFTNLFTFIVLAAITAMLKFVLNLSWKQLTFVIIPILILTFILQTNYFYLILFGVLLTSVIHVYLFTLLHMISGAIKSNSKIDFSNAILLIIIPIVIYFIPENILVFEASTSSNKFISDLVGNLSYFLGHVNISNSTFYKLSWFISFSYLYHYLNWFSKTKIIQWDNSMTRKKTILFCSISIGCTLVFLIKFEYGLIATLFLSYLHVFAEFPLNYQSFKNIGLALFTKVKS